MRHFTNDRRGQERLLSKPLCKVIILCPVALVLLGCPKFKSANSSLGPPDVLVTKVIQQDVPVVREWIGSMDGSVNADVRARVSGYLLSKNYKEGRVVQKGDLLFEIDPNPYEAIVEQSKASLAQAQANQLQTDQTAGREIELFKQKVESKQNLDNAVQANEASKAEVKAQEAALRQAQLNLGFTKVVSPITGVAGIANPDIGDLVGPTDAQPLTTVSTVDPIKVYFQLSEQDYLKLAPRIEESRRAGQSPPPAEIILANGMPYPLQGTFSAIDRQVDDQTGTIRLVALFPNPNNILRPGQFCRIRATARTVPRALLVPQRAVKELQTSYELAVVNGDNKAEIRSVKVGERVGSLWIIEEGVKAGEQVIVEGMQKVRAGETVKPATWTPPSSQAH